MLPNARGVTQSYRTLIIGAGVTHPVDAVPALMLLGIGIDDVDASDAWDTGIWDVSEWQ